MSLAWDMTTKTDWPDMSKDRKATEQARKELGPNADVHVLLARAQQIKDTL